MPYLVRLYATLCFDSTLSRPEANRVIRIADELSCRQSALAQIESEPRAEG